MTEKKESLWRYLPAIAIWSIAAWMVYEDWKVPPRTDFCAEKDGRWIHGREENVCVRKDAVILP